MINSKVFNYRYSRTAKTWKDADLLVQELAPSDRRKLHYALSVVDEFMGLDMRQEFYKTILKHSTV